MDSILTSIKKLLGIIEECTDFDQDIIMHINSVLMGLTQIGVGPNTGFLITGKDNTWDEFILQDDDVILLEGVKSYVYLKVRLLFDPPQTSTLIESINRMVSELEWRISVAVDPKVEEEEIQNGE